MTLQGAALGALELRHETGGARLRGRFPYATETDLAPGRAEVFEPGAFAARIEGGADIHLLFGHDYDRPLASRGAGSLTLRDTGAAVEFEAQIDPGTTWARDFLAAHAAGLIRGLSPGFRVPPGGERVERRGGGLLRRIVSAELHELSAVTRPAYAAAMVEARNWHPQVEAPDAGLRRTLGRWRA